MDIELVTEGLRFPEGPIAMADGSVILTEIEGKCLTRVLPDGRKETVADTGGGPNGAAIGPDGAIYVTNNGGSFEFMKANGLNIPGPTPPSHKGGYIQRVDIKSGKVEEVYGPNSCAGGRLNGPNDLVFDRTGGMWFTDNGCSDEDGRKWGGVYYARPDGSKITRVREHMVSPNGIGLSPDEKTLYVANSDPERAVWMAYPLKEDGTIGTGRVFFDATRGVKTLKGLPDGLKVDRDGNLFATGPGGVLIFAPDGTHLGTLNTGEATANVGWGDDGSTLYITADMYLGRLKTSTMGRGF